MSSQICSEEGGKMNSVTLSIKVAVTTVDVLIALLCIASAKGTKPSAIIGLFLILAVNMIGVWQ